MNPKEVADDLKPKIHVLAKWSTTQEIIEEVDATKTNSGNLELFQVLYELNGRTNDFYFFCANSISDIITYFSDQLTFEQIDQLTNWILTITNKEPQLHQTTG